MGKYDFKTTGIKNDDDHDQTETTYDHDLSYPLECIANELAEVNRLKRLEFRKIFADQNKVKFFVGDEELIDQA